jgi:hypothetical protein
VGVGQPAGVTGESPRRPEPDSTSKVRETPRLCPVDSGLGGYLADDAYPLAGRVSQAAGEHIDAATGARHGYDFEIRRVLDGLATLI